MDNLYVVASYVNFDLKIMVYNVFDKKPLLLYEESILKMDILNINNDIEKDRICAKMQRAIDNAKKIIKNPNPKLYVVFDPKDYYYVQKSFTFDFGSQHVVTESDLTKAMNMSMYDEVAEEGYKIVNFLPTNTIVDGKKEVKNVVGHEVSSLTITGEVLMSDTPTYYALISLLSGVDIELASMFIGNNLVKNQMEIEPGCGFLEVGTRTMDFTFNMDGEIKQTTLAVGFEQILNDLYASLLDDFDSKSSEDAVRFIMHYFPLNEYDTSLNVIDDIELNSLISKFNTLIVNYFKHIFNELKKQKISIDNFNIILHEYPLDEFITLLNENIDIQFQQPNIVSNTSTLKENMKSFYLIKLLATDVTQKINRGEHG